MHVIAKAYANQPLDRIVVEREGGIIYLVNPAVSRSQIEEEKSGVGFPADCVFAFDSQLYTKLNNAWSAGDQATLAALWSAAQLQQAHAGTTE